jgi:hypothetical protein
MRFQNDIHALNNTYINSSYNSNINMFQEAPQYCLRLKDPQAAPGSSASAAGRATIAFLPEGRTLTLEEFKCALEIRKSIPASVAFSNSQLLHCNA